MRAPAALRLLAAALAGAMLAGCGLQPVGAPEADLAAARHVCDAQYPRRIGNYLRHALCFNAAVERHAIPTARYPDLVRLQEEARVRLAEKVDRRQIGVQTGEHRMREADTLVAAAGRERDAGKEDGARRRLAAIDALLR